MGVISVLLCSVIMQSQVKGERRKMLEMDNSLNVIQVLWTASGLVTVALPWKTELLFFASANCHQCDLYHCRLYIQWPLKFTRQTCTPILNIMCLTMSSPKKNSFSSIHEKEGNTRAAPPLSCLLSNLVSEWGIFEWINKTIRRTLKLIGWREGRQQRRAAAWTGWGLAANLWRRIIVHPVRRVAGTVNQGIQRKRANWSKGRGRLI